MKNILHLTEDQKAVIKGAFGEDVHELPFAIEEFNVTGAGGGKLKVLKIDNIAKVQASGIGSGQTVN